MNGTVYRLREFLNASGQPSLMLDASAGLALGILPGLEDFWGGLMPLLGLLDALVCSPGQMSRRPQRQPGSSRTPALLARMDWTNTLRGPASPLAPRTPRRVPLLSPQDALESGATAMVGTFLLGYDEELEAECLRDTVQWALAGKESGLPLVVEVVPSGPRVSLPGKAVELGASYALEGGADAIVVPYPGQTSLKTIGDFVSVPWLLKPSDRVSATALSEVEQAMDAGAAGLWLDQAVLAESNPADVLNALRREATMVHDH